MDLLTTSSSSSSPLLSSSSEREVVIVVTDGNRDIKGNVDAVEWALNNVVRPGDSVVVLGVIYEIGTKNHSCFPLNVRSTITGIWERLEFSSGHGEVNPRELGEEIERKREQYQRSLQPFYRQCKKNEVKLEVKLAAGYCPRKVTVEEAQNSNTRWIVLDSRLKKYTIYIYGHVGCNVALMRGKDFATLMPSKVPGNKILHSPHNNSQPAVTEINGVSCHNHIQNLQSLQERQPPSPCWFPLSWRTGFPRVFALSELEEMTNEFSDDYVFPEVDYPKVYGGIFQDTLVIINSFSENDERFWTMLMILSRIRHRNIANMVGYCCSGSGRFLLTDYPCMGSVESNLKVDESARKLTWNARWYIAVEIGGSLRYLHEECRDEPIAHQSVSSSNIVVSHCRSAMLSNFQTAKLLNEESAADQHQNFEDDQDELLSVDIHDYGVFLLELITGRSARLFSGHYAGQSLIDWALPHIESGCLTQVMDPRLIDPSSNSWEVHQMAKAALLCLKNYHEKSVAGSYTPCSISEVLAVVHGDRLAISKG